MEKLLRKLESMEPGERAKMQKLLREEKSEAPSMEWMYKSEQPDTEEYLLGRRIDKHIEEKDTVEESKDAPGASFQEVIARRADMDMHAKMREDPLYAIRQKEEEAKRRLLQNPVKMKQLEKLMKERDKKMKKDKKKKKKKKHKKTSSSDDSDDDIVNKYLAILEQKKAKKSVIGDESEGKRPKDDLYPQGRDVERTHGHDRGEGRRKRQSESEENRSHRHTHVSSDDELASKAKMYGLLMRGEKPQRSRNKSDDHAQEPTRRSNERSHEPSRRSNERSHRQDERSDERSHKSSRHKSRSPHRKHSTSHKRERSRSPQQKQQKKLSSEDMARKRAEMMENARWRDEQREQNVKRYRDEEAKERQQHEEKGGRAEFLNPMMMKHADNSTVEDRIKRNMYNIQRTRSDLDKNFAKR